MHFIVFTPFLADVLDMLQGGRLGVTFARVFVIKLLVL